MKNISYFCFSILVLFSAIQNIAAQTITLSYDARGNRIAKVTPTNIPVAVITGPTLVCQGSLVQFTASGGDSHQWIGGPSQANFAAIINGSDTLRAIAIKGPGCRDTAIHIVNTRNTPSVVRVTGDSTVQGGESAFYRIPAIADAAYNWTVVNGTILSGQNTDSVKVQWNAQGADSGSVNVCVNLLNCPPVCMTKRKVIITPLTGTESLVFRRFRAYPNPARDAIQIDIELPAASPLWLELRNSVGQSVFTRNLMSGSVFSFNISGKDVPASGLYHLSVQTTTTKEIKTIIFLQ